MSLNLDDVEADTPACLHCSDQGHVCDWCDEPPGDCYCVDALDDHGTDDEAAADRWSRCTWCREALE